MTKPLFKTTVVIWSTGPPQRNDVALSALAREAEVGDSYCSKMESIEVLDPAGDRDWDCTEFFDED